MGPWDVCRKVFNSSDHKGMSLIDKSDLFFHDYSLGPLFVQENYLSAVPKVGENDKRKHMLLVSKAADSLCQGDLVEATIRSRNSWNLLPVQVSPTFSMQFIIRFESCIFLSLKTFLLSQHGKKN